MRTTIDMPDALMERVKTVAAKRKTTFRALVVDALERTLDEPLQDFQLQDAAVGPTADIIDSVNTQTINQAIDEHRKNPFIP